MNKNLTNKIRQDFDRIAMHDVEQWDHNNHYHQFLLKQLPPDCRSILDIGCGTGQFTRALSSYAEEEVAIDLSPNSIKLAKQKSSEFDNIDYQVGDVRECNFMLNRFDAIVSIATVHHLSLSELLPKIKTSLKPGGVFIKADPIKRNLRL